MEVSGRYLKDEEGNVFSPITNIKTIFNDDGISLLDLFYPIGSIYETLNGAFNPNISWGGTWTLLKNGEVLIDSGYTREGQQFIIDTYVGDSVGEKWHTLTIEEMPSHTHTFTGSSVTTSSNGTHSHNINYNNMANKNIGLNHDNTSRAGVQLNFLNDDYVGAYIYAIANGAHTHTVTAKGSNSNTGGGITFELTPKGLIVARWHRTA